MPIVVFAHAPRSFESRYSPWLNLQPHRGEISPLIMLARCTVASRHLDSVTCASIVQQLQKLTEEAIYRQVFNPTPSIQSIEAIQILALWSPHGHGEVRDGRLLIASAISMAMNLRLNKAVEYAAELYGLVNTRTNSMASDQDGAIEKARLVCPRIYFINSMLTMSNLYSGSPS